MEWQLILALVIAIPIILIPAVFVWYLNLGWIFSHAKEAARERKAAREKGVGVEVKTK